MRTPGTRNFLSGATLEMTQQNTVIELPPTTLQQYIKQSPATVHKNPNQSPATVYKAVTSNSA